MAKSRRRNCKGFDPMTHSARDLLAKALSDNGIVTGANEATRTRVEQFWYDAAITAIEAALSPQCTEPVAWQPIPKWDEKVSGRLLLGDLCLGVVAHRSALDWSW